MSIVLKKTFSVHWNSSRQSYLIKQHLYRQDEFERALEISMMKSNLIKSFSEVEINYDENEVNRVNFVTLTYFDGLFAYFVKPPTTVHKHTFKC